MTLQYPDVMNDLTDARRRFKSGAVQYLAEFAPGPAPAGEIAPLVLTLQSTVDAALHLGIYLHTPRPRGRLRRLSQAPFEIKEPTIRLTLEGGEVGQLTVPVRIHPQVPPDKYPFRVRIDSETRPDAPHVRPDSTVNQIERLKIRYPQGLGITQIASWGFETAKRDTQELVLEVIEGSGEPEEADLTPRFDSLWMPRHWDIVAAAEREMNERRLHILSALSLDRVALAMLRASPTWFAGSGVRLHVGEALFVAKILTYTVAHLMEDLAGQNCLLVPILAYAMANEQPTGDLLWTITQLGYAHVLELAIALSFALVEEVVGRRMWNAAEQRAARDFIVGSLSDGTPLPAGFLYLPLILGGLAVAHEVVLEGEEVEQSVGLLKSARAERATEFADQEWRDVTDLVDLLAARQEKA